jgi:hypothetical protein
MERHADVLARQGWIAARSWHGQQIWSVRFRERQPKGVIQRAIYIGPESQQELVQRARALLRSYRELGQLPEILAGYNQMLTAFQTLVRPMRREI